MKRFFILFALLMLPFTANAQGGSPDQTTRSPRGDFRIEQFQTNQGESAWVVSARQRTHLGASQPPDHINPANVSFTTDFAISPNEQYIFGAQKYVRSVGLAYLYRRASGLNYRPATTLRFDEAAWRYFHRQRPQDTVPTIDDGGRIVDFVSWSRDSRHLHIQLRGHISAYWLADYDTLTGQFRLLSHSPNSFVK